MPDNSYVVNVHGKTILPGFINSHIHMAYNQKNLFKWARDGVTTVRDLGASAPYLEKLFKTRNSLNGKPVTAHCYKRTRFGTRIGCGGG